MSKIENFRNFPLDFLIKKNSCMYKNGLGNAHYASFLRTDVLTYSDICKKIKKY
jgi:hypothetical protein